MSYSSLYKLNQGKTNTIPDSLNDPYNKFSYKLNIMENFIPLNYGGISRTEEKKQTEQQAIQQQIIQLNKQQELLKEEKEKAENLKKLNILQKVNFIRQRENENKLNLIQNLENDIKILNNLLLEKNADYQ